MSNWAPQFDRGSVQEFEKENELKVISNKNQDINPQNDIISFKVDTVDNLRNHYEDLCISPKTNSPNAYAGDYNKLELEKDTLGNENQILKQLNIELEMSVLEMRKQIVDLKNNN